MPPGSCSRAHVMVPPVGTFFPTRWTRLLAAAAGPAREPATSAPAPTFPALDRSSRRLNSLDIVAPPPWWYYGLLQNLADAGGVALDVVVERGLAELETRKLSDARRIEREAEAGLAGDADLALGDLHRLGEHVGPLQWVVRVVCEGKVRGCRGEMDVGRCRHAELGPAPDRAPLARGRGERGDLRGTGQAARLGRVDDEDVARLPLDQLERRAEARARLVGRDRRGDRPAHGRHALEVEVGHRLLGELEIELLERLDPLDRGRNAPVHVRVDADLDVVADAVADRRQGVVVLGEVAPDLQLQLRVAGLDEVRRLLRVRRG